MSKLLSVLLCVLLCSDVAVAAKAKKCKPKQVYTKKQETVQSNTRNDYAPPPPKPSVYPKANVPKPSVPKPNTCQSGNLIKNPSFEENPGCAPGESWCFVSDTTVPHWKSSSGQIEIDNAVWPSHGGKTSTDLSTNAPIVISQDIQLVKGQSYKLKFALRKNPCGNGRFRSTVQSAGSDGMDLNVQEIGTNSWRMVEKTFTASGSQAIVSFESLSGSSCGPVIDSIELTCADSQDSPRSDVNLVKNWSFEQNAGCAGKSWCIDSVSKVPFWQSSTGNIEIDLTVWPAHHGKASVDLSTTKPIMVYQELVLNPGQQYQLTFELRKNPCGNGKMFYKVAQVAAGVARGDSGTLFGEETGTVTWKTVTDRFTAENSRVNLIFGSESGDSCGPVIDSITLISI